METKVNFLNTDCNVEIGRYPNGRIAIQLIDAEDGEPFATATINIPMESLAKDEVIIKNYSKNEGIEPSLIEAGILLEKVRMVGSGFTHVPVYKINPDLLG